MLEEFFDSPLLQQEFLGNTIAEYGLVALIFVTTMVLFWVIQSLIIMRFQTLADRTETDIDDTLIEIVRSVKPGFYFFLSVFISIQFLAIDTFLFDLITKVLIIWVIYQIIIGLQILINYIARKGLAKEDEPSSKQAVRMVGRISGVILWSLGVLFILSNLGINVTSLVAGLGISGIAVALALQSVLGDVFSSLVIFFDKPFQVGDFIMVDDKAGTVERVGFKTTRIRSAVGEQIVVSNTDLTSSRVQNFKRLEERRVSFKIGVVYDTTLTKMKKIPTIIKKIVKGVDGVRFDRAHFTSFDDSAMTFDIVYYVESSNYVEYLDANQKILLEVKKQFDNERIDMAFPTQTVYEIQVKK